MFAWSMKIVIGGALAGVAAAAGWCCFEQYRWLHIEPVLFDQ